MFVGLIVKVELHIIFLAVLFLTGCFNVQLSRETTYRVELPSFSLGVAMPASANIPVDQIKVTRLILPDFLNKLPLDFSLYSDFRWIEAFQIEPENALLQEDAILKIHLGSRDEPDSSLFLFYVSGSGYLSLISVRNVGDEASTNFPTRTFGTFLLGENRRIKASREETVVLGFADIAEGSAPLTVKFTAVGVGGKAPYKFFWAFGDGNGGFGEEVIHTYKSPAEYVVTLKAQDPSGNVIDGFAPIISVLKDDTELRSCQVEYVPVDSKYSRTLRFFPTIFGVKRGGHNNSSLAGGYAKNTFVYEWAFGDGSFSVEPTPTHSYSKGSIYSAKLKVKTQSGKSLEKKFTVDLREIGLTANHPYGIVPHKVVFSLKCSDLSQLFEIYIDFGDGSSGTFAMRPDITPIITHTYSEVGTFRVSGRVSADASDVSNEKSWRETNELYILVFPNPNPSVRNLSSSFARIGEELKLFGSDFGPMMEERSLVMLGGGVKAKILEWHDREIRFQVPEEAKSGEVYVRRHNYQSNRVYLTILDG